MTVTELEVEVAKGESDTLEFKKSTAERESAMKTLCGMLNGSGGRVFIGVTEAGKVRGQEVSDTTLKDMAQVITPFDPATHIQQERVVLPDGKQVFVLTVDPSPLAPHTFHGRPYRRVNSTTSVMPQTEYQRRLLERDHATLRWENRTAAGDLELDLSEVQRTLTDAVAAGRLESSITDPKRALEKFGLVVGNRLTQAAVVGFAVEPFPLYPQCALRLARFRGVTKAEFLDQHQLTGHAFKLLHEADVFIRRHLPVAGRFEPGVMERRDDPLFPPLALREALVNALVHRDYSIPGGAVSVAIYDDRLEVISTGTLPFGLTVADLLTEHVSKPRNPLLADLFYRRGLIERWGRGTQKIIDLCVAAGHPRPEFEEQAGDVVVRFIQSGYVPPHKVEHGLTDRQRRILHALRDGRARLISSIQRMLSPQPAQQTLRDDLNFLRQLNLVRHHGHGRGSRWWLVKAE